VIDGPFAETKVHLAGYYIMNCENLDEADRVGGEDSDRLPGR
jgi:hypothetical protein